MVLLLKQLKVIGLTVSVLLLIARSVEGRTIRITCDTDQLVIRSNVNGASEQWLAKRPLSGVGGM